VHASEIETVKSAFQGVEAEIMSLKEIINERENELQRLYEERNEFDGVRHEKQLVLDELENEKGKYASLDRE
jgi:hypothetical protein